MNTTPYSFRLSLVLVFLFAFIFLDAPKVEAQYFSFGKNKVQYKDFDWRFIQSEHFDVYYYTDRNYDLANFSALALEPALKQIGEDFDHQINDRIEVIIYDSHNDFSETNVVGIGISEGIGGVTDAFKNRITMPYDGDYEQFRRVLQHELEHAVVNDMFYGGGVQSRVSGNALQIPLWFNEGMAEYLASGWDTESDMFIRDAIINDYLAPITRLSGFFAYRGGQSVWNYIEKEYGRNKITEIVQTLHEYRNVQAAFQRSLGLTLEELSERWKDFYRERYLPEVAEREDIDNFADLLTERGKAGTYNTSPAYSPQGDKIAMITNERGYFDIVVLNAITGEKIKTLIKGSDNVDFEELNILNPNLDWSPNGQKIVLSAKSEGKDQLAIVDYESKKKQFIAFPNIDAIGSVSWSPDGNKIAFDGNIGPFQDIFVYNLETQKLMNLTNDVATDTEPVWASNSETVYFTSARGDMLQLDKLKNNAELLATDDMYTTDIYALRVGDTHVQRLTQTPLWNEYEPETTRDGRLIFISDENGIPNVYQLNLNDRTTAPLTNLQTGALQISVSGDGSRLAVNSINEGFTDIFTISSPFSRKKEERLKDNVWAQRRLEESFAQRVPAIGYSKNFVRSKQFVFESPVAFSRNPYEADSTLIIDADMAATDTTTIAEQPADTAQTEEPDSDNIDFRNYVFSSEVEEDTVFTNKYIEEDVFELENNNTDDGRYIPNDYRLEFSTDLVYAGGGFSTFSGVNGLTQIRFSDLLGDHIISFGTNLQFDLRNSDYFVQYGNLKNRVNWLYNLSHTAYNFRTFRNEGIRYRYLSGGVTAQYPLDKFRRIDFTLSGVNISQDITALGRDTTDNQSRAFAYPQITYTNDKTLPGFTSPRAGFRYSIGISGSPPITSETLQFGSVLGDFRKYFNLGPRYGFAVRGSGGASFGRNAQTFFLGGVQGWVNREFTDNVARFDQFFDSFLSPPAIPLRGHEYFAITGDKFTLLNAEFRFPLFAALLPGPIPLLPLYNITGVAFIDAGTAWGDDVEYFLPRANQDTDEPYFTNDEDLDFTIREERTQTETFTDRNGNQVQAEFPAPEGDILIGAGVGLRAIVFGLPLRYDVGWPYFRDGFGGDPVHYISIGVDF
jgi:hypothetical protein